MIYAFLAPGFEETEAVTTIDILRRARLNVLTVAVGTSSLTVTGNHKIPVICDALEGDVSPDEQITAVFLPGGVPGTPNLEASETVRSFVEYCVKSNKTVMAICAAPSILGHMGLLNGIRATCYPGYESDLTGAKIVDELAVADSCFVTGKGAGCAVEFALTAVSQLCGNEKAAEIARSIQCR